MIHWYLMRNSRVKTRKELIGLKHLVVVKCKEVLKKWWGHVKRTEKLMWMLEFQRVNVEEGMVEIEKWQFGKQHSSNCNNFAGKYHQWMLKLVEESMIRNKISYLHNLRVLFPCVSFSYKEKYGSFIHNIGTWCTQYASKFGKLSSGHRTGKGQFSFQSQRKAMPKNAQTTTQLHSSHTLVK